MAIDFTTVKGRDMRALLNWLKEQDKPVTVAEILTKTKRRIPQPVNRMLQNLALDGYIIKVPGRGAAFRYKFLTENPGSKESKTPEYFTRVIQPNDLLGLLKSFAEEKWMPKSAKPGSYGRLPYAIRRLYNFAHDRASGSRISQGEYDGVRKEVSDLRDEVASFLTTLNGILDTPALWDANGSAKFLLSPGGSSLDYDALANKIQQTQL